MISYIAIRWEPTSAPQGAAAAFMAQRVHTQQSRWNECFARDGLRVFYRGTSDPSHEVLALDGKRGVILGTLFARASMSQVVPVGAACTLTEGLSEKILQTRGQELADNYWGRYVAIIDDLESRSTWVFRDPVGDIQCFHTSFRNIAVIFSSVEDCVRLKCFDFSINWPHVALQALTGAALEDESALNEIVTVRPGELLECAGSSSSRRFLWDPYRIATSNILEDASQAVSEMRSTAMACVRTWGARYDRILHQLSGGFDSSLILACLAKSPKRPEITCANLRTIDPNSDERPYARLAAARAACILLEKQRATTMRLEQLLEFEHTAAPSNVVMHSLEVQPVIRELAREAKAEAIFGGDGGDSLFFKALPELTVMDFMWHHGMSPKVLQVAASAASLSLLSVWKLCAEGARYGALRRRRNLIDPFVKSRKLPSDDFARYVKTRDDLLNPRRLIDSKAPPGKRMHVFLVTSPILFRDPLRKADDPEQINPLMSQPLLELCLRIPTYLFIGENLDRVIARRAFAGEIPPEILARQWKGGVERHYKSLFAQNLTFARTLLLDGQLVKEGVLDRKKVEQALSGGPGKATTYASELFDYVSIEAWATRWGEARRKAVA